MCEILIQKSLYAVLGVRMNKTNVHPTSRPTPKSSSCFLHFFIDRTTFLPVTVCGCETWSVTLRQEHRRWMFNDMLTWKKETVWENSWCCGPTQSMVLSFLKFLDHIQRREKFVKNPLDKWSARRRERTLPDNTQHSQQTNIHDPGRIRTRNISRRAAVNPCQRPRGHWEGPVT
jgi:hypothetical protein